MARILLAALLMASGMAHSHDQTDVITMYNGDKITGEIKGLDYGALRVKTQYANEFSLEWWHIASIESQYNFEIQTDEGERLYGNISRSDKKGQLTFTSIEDSAVIDLLKITEMRPIEDSFADAFTYTLGASLNLEPQLATAQLKATVGLATERTKNTGKLMLQESTTRIRADVSAEIAWEMVDDLFLTVSTTTQYDSGKPDDEVTRNEKLDYNVVMGVTWRP